MDHDSSQYLMSNSSRQVPQSHSDVSNDYEEAYWDEDGEQICTEFPCPYCNDDFDLVELCCHIDDVHFGQAKNGVCPVCAVGVSANMIAHLTKKHGKMIKIQHKLQLLKGKPDANLSLLLKEFHEEYMKSLLDSSSTGPPSAMEPDPLLSSFFCNVPSVSQSESVQSTGSTKSSCVTILESTQNKKSRVSEFPCHPFSIYDGRTIQSPPLSDKEHEERAHKSEFVQGIIWSTFLDDNS